MDMAVAREQEPWTPCSVPADFMSGCRRAASFPFFGDHSLVPISALKVRSHSDSEGLNKFRFASVTIDSLRRRPRDTLTIQEREETSDCCSDADSSSSSSSDECDESGCCTPVQTNESFFSETPSSAKSVRFADDCGQDLFSVRVMTEASEEPPRLSPSVLRRWKVSNGDGSASRDKPPEWRMVFQQPASEYVRFRETLEKEKVALENIIIKGDKFVGSIKVVNQSFEKRVFVRFSNNSWKSYVDRNATYQPSTSKTYDTFTFELEMPKAAEKIQQIEFCVCYVENECSHWDSNFGKNYRIEAIQEQPERKRSFPSLFGGYKSLDSNDAYRMETTDWARFASWKNLSTDSPYW